MNHNFLKGEKYLAQNDIINLLILLSEILDYTMVTLQQLFKFLEHGGRHFAAQIFNTTFRRKNTSRKYVFKFLLNILENISYSKM